MQTRKLARHELDKRQELLPIALEPCRIQHQLDMAPSRELDRPVVGDRI